MLNSANAKSGATSGRAKENVKLRIDARDENKGNAAAYNVKENQDRQSEMILT